MTKRLLYLVLAIFAFASTGTINADDDIARLQIIHNAADPGAELVDIWVNGDKLLDDFAFRAATPFIDVPAGVDLNVGVAPGTSGSADDILATFTFNLQGGQSYIAIANGVLDPNDFEANPNSLNIDFDIFAKDHAREQAKYRWFVEFIGFHGATDAPTVDIRIADWRWGPVINNLSYGEFSRYKRLWATRYVLEVTPGNSTEVVAAFDADLSGLRGASAVVFASGFLSPDNDQDGAAFGLFAALADGTVVEFPALSNERFAEIQIIHNAADPSADVVDIWVNGEKFLDDFAFRSATPFVEVPAGVPLAIGVAPGNSMTSDDIIATFDVTLTPEKRYIAVASGVLDPSMYAENPSGKNIAFNIFADDGIRLKSGWRSLVNVKVFHGATDAPKIDVVLDNRYWRWPLVNNLKYGRFTGYRYLRPMENILNVTPYNDNNTVVASFRADLTGLAGETAIVFASGFLSPDNNQGGPAFGLFAALTDGTVVEFEPVMADPMARLQVIHNAADPGAELVDIWVNGDKLLDDFAFRAATPFIDVPAETDLTIGVAGPTSMSQADALAEFTVNLDNGGTYVVLANGVLSDGFEANPDGRDIAFTLFSKDEARESALGGSHEVDFFAVHGATDAPMVDVIARDVATLIDDAAYGDVTDYVTVPAGAYTLDVTPANDNNTIVASFSADLSGLGGGSAVVFASGFLTPDGDDQNGPAFGLYAALADGTVVGFPAVDAEFAAKGSGLPESFELRQNYPNPFNPTTNISFALPSASNVSLVVYNLLGQEVATLVDGPMDAGEQIVEFDASRLSSGVYFYRLTAESFAETRKMMLVK